MHSISTITPCLWFDDQAEAAGGDETAQQCGWLKDKFGLSWQIVPSILPDMLADADTRKSGRVMSALLNMKKLDIAALQSAYAGQA